MELNKEDKLTLLLSRLEQIHYVLDVLFDDVSCRLPLDSDDFIKVKYALSMFSNLTNGLEYLIGDFNKEYGVYVEENNRNEGLLKIDDE